MATDTSEPNTIMAKQPKASLFTIAKELRDLIYEHTLVEDEPIIVSKKWMSLCGKFCRVEPGLLAVCQQIRKEAIFIFYSKNVFEIDKCFGAWAFLEQLGPGKIRWLKVLHFYARGWRSTTTQPRAQKTEVIAFPREFYQFGLRPEAVSVRKAVGAWIVLQRSESYQVGEDRGGRWSVQ